MSAKTSRSHPLEIGQVHAGAGRIGLTFCPGKKQAVALAGPWDRDLGLDLDRIDDIGTRALVSVIELHELDDLGVPTLGQAVENRGIEWHHISVVDDDVPDATAEARWCYTSARLRRLCAAGETVVIHCKGGLGRTGSLAAQLLIDFGSDSEDAIAAVRAARPGAIQTQAQESYVRSRRPQPLPVDGPTRVDRILGCIIGGAVGDGFGYAVEFDRHDTITKQYGPDGLRDPVFDQDRLIVSDDTQMTLFTIEGLARAVLRDTDLGVEAVVDEVHGAYLRWLATQGASVEFPDPPRGLIESNALWNRRAPGNTCLSALLSGRRGTIEHPLNDSKGCGGVMRAAPLGLIEALSLERAFELGTATAALTHGHPSGYWSAGALAMIIRDLLKGTALDAAVAKAIETTATREGGEETVAALELALNRAATTGGDYARDVDHIGEGWVGEEALAIAVYAATVGDSMPDAIRIATNHDGDSDSTASIAAQLWGAQHGLDDLPHPWARRLDLFDPVVSMARELWLLG
jgi:ADP-ribosylglycohydrolase/protein-tyrosine phosphatase